MIKTIIVPIDGSDHATKAGELAADMAAKYGAELIFLHALLRHTTAFEIPALLSDATMPTELARELAAHRAMILDTATYSDDASPVLLPIPDDLLRKIKLLILEKAQTSAEGRGVEHVSVQIANGEPAESIIVAAEREHADAIVMGSRGLGSIASLLMGSVSHTVSHLAKCTCITVK